MLYGAGSGGLHVYVDAGNESSAPRRRVPAMTVGLRVGRGVGADVGSHEATGALVG